MLLLFSNFLLLFTLPDVNLDSTKVYNELREKISLIAAPEVYSYK